MNFKNALERHLFEIALRVCGEGVSVEHNKTIQIEVATAPEVAAFAGPPKKEIDVITAGFRQCPDVEILISGKEYSNSKAEPADVQEWAAVIRTMNKYSAGTKYLGLVVCPIGFTRGCEAWAASNNLGLIPPLKGKKISLSLETYAQMFQRALGGLGKRLHFPHSDLFRAPEFYEFVYRMTEGFEGRDEAVEKYGSRYRLLGSGWTSSFGELITMLMGKTLQNIVVTATGIYLKFSDDLAFRLISGELHFGFDDGKLEGLPASIRCEKNYFPESCSFDFIKKHVIGQEVTSAGDWRDRFEFGLTDDLMLAIEPDRLQIYRTRNPADRNLL